MIKRPFQILAGNNDITAIIADRLLSLSLTDEEGFKSDRLEMTLDNRAPPLEFSFALSLKVSLLYQEKLIEMGAYHISEITDSAPPHTLRLSATALSFQEGFKILKERSWNNITLGHMVEKIAFEHELKPAISRELSSLSIPHIDQSESDMALLHRLAKTYGATFKISDNTLTLTKKATATTASGLILPTVEIDFFHRRSHKRMVRESYSGVKAYYWDEERGERRALVVGSSQNLFTLRFNLKDEKTARDKALSKLKELNEANESLEFELSFNPSLSPERTLIVKNINPSLDGSWRIIKVVHELKDSFTSTVECRRKH